MGKSTISMAIFNSKLLNMVKLPEGNRVISVVVFLISTMKSFKAPLKSSLVSCCVFMWCLDALWQSNLAIRNPEIHILDWTIVCKGYENKGALTFTQKTIYHIYRSCFCSSYSSYRLAHRWSCIPEVKTLLEIKASIEAWINRWREGSAVRINSNQRRSFMIIQLFLVDNSW